ncbi:hypothetical protein L7F22_039138 [Adiantum nelumboides]|nr:hypothetical protein [Adiantum nelumboides]
MTRISQHIVLLVAFTCILWVHSAFGKPSQPPLYFDENSKSANRVPLTAPDHHNINNEDHITFMQKRYITEYNEKRATQDAVSNSNASATNVNDKAQMIGYLGYAYYAPLNVSKTNPQSLFVQLDTGSADLWIVSSSCQSQQCQTDTVLKFDESKSDSFHWIQVDQNSTTGQRNVTVSAQGAQATGSPSSSSSGIIDSNNNQKRKVSFPNILAVQQSDTGSEVPFDVIYDDNTAATGLLATDQIMLANLAAPNQMFGLVNSTNVTLQTQGISGVLGMGFPRGSAIARSLIGQVVNTSTSPVLTNILSNNSNSYPLFTLLLNQTGGDLTLGAADPEILTTEEERGQVEWHDVVPFPSGNTARPSNASVNTDAEALGSYLYWALRLSAVGFNGRNVNITPTYQEVGRTSLALIDSGAPGIVGPPGQVDALFGQIDGARHVGSGRYVVPCTTQQSMFFSFGGRNFTLLPTDYMIGRATGNPYLCLAWPAASEASPDGVDWVLGQPFLRSQYTLFSLGIANREAPKIGIYPLRSSADSTNSTEIFQAQSTSNISAYLSMQTPIATTLPNSLVPLSTALTTPQYVFANATNTPSIGLLPTAASNAGNKQSRSTYSPILTATTDDSNLPVLSNPVSNLPVPSNPAERASDAAFSIHSNTLITKLVTVFAVMVVFVLLSYS